MWIKWFSSVNKCLRNCLNLATILLITCQKNILQFMNLFDKQTMKEDRQDRRTFFED